MGKYETVMVANPGENLVVATRLFDVSRELLFAAYTDPARLPRWWGPSETSIVVDELDVRAGGRWRFLLRDPDGNELAFRGVYHEVRPPARLIYTFEFEDLPGRVLLETVAFDTDADGKTRLTDVSIFPSVDARDGMVESGMEKELAETMDRLEELVLEKVG
ncbi:MAG: SRPBCC family protein [Mycobacteriales bacterium]